MHHHPLKAAVTHQDVAATSEDEERQRVLAGQLQGSPEFLQGTGKGKIPRRPAYLEGSVRL
jgi:hypothetical protein